MFQQTNHKNTIIFDGACNLCNGVVGWLLKYTAQSSFNFIPFQSPEGQHILESHNKPTASLDTIILIDHKGLHTHSDGFLRVIATIPKWRLAAALLAFIPKIIRDTIYKKASRNRLKWFGKSNSCYIGLQY